MTIEERIHSELDRLSKENTEIHSVAVKLNEKFNKLIGEVQDHLGEISNEMREYDKHDASHSEAVLEIIEKLLQEQHIEELTLLEAMVLRFCCYFHDTGMILPAFCKPLLEQVESDPKAEPKDGLMKWLRAGGNDFDSRKELFLLPGKRDQYHDFLIRELVAYRDFRLGLGERPEDITPEDYIQMTRHHHLRKHHGERSKTYAANLGRFFAEVIHGSEAELAEVIGDVCAAHSWEIEKVRKLPAKKELFLNCTELSCNVRYLAMLLRLGDLLHFGPERASKTLYLERRTMNPESDLHWLAKQGTRGYVISPTPSGGVNIAYHGSFDKPNEYYFVQGHLSWVDEELNCYEAFRRQMEKASGDQRYDLGLPEKVNGDHMTARGFTPNRDFKFRLEHRNIIELLMGARLYRDEFMCLRELYQNALDACRCMRAERPGVEREIEFGLGTDDNGDYLYCKDQGTGMTMDIVKNYLLRIGNSYYKSDEFRRKNAHWDNAVAPVSEFGIGLLSCYMIADRIDVITRHYTAVEEEKPIWISMTDNDDFGYQLETDWFIEDELGEHGTIVRLYLKEKYKPMATGYIPEEPRDAAFLLSHLDEEDRCDLTEYENSLYHRVQQFVHLPEEGIPVFIRGIDRREKLFRADEWYDFVARIPKLEAYGMEADELWELALRYSLEALSERGEGFLREVERADASFVTYPLRVEDVAQKASVSVILRLPKAVMDAALINELGNLNQAVCQVYDKVYIDGMPIRCGRWREELCYSFRGAVRPRLTVDRGEIREVPDAVAVLRDALREKLVESMADTIRAHAARYPEAITPAFWDRVIRVFDRYASEDQAAALLAELSGHVMKDYIVWGAAMHDWFYGDSLSLDVEAAKRRRGIMRAVLYHHLLHAASVGVENGRLSIRKGGEIASWEDDAGMLPAFLGNYGNLNVLVRADLWPECYGDYDAVSGYPNLFPTHAWKKLISWAKAGDRLLLGRRLFENQQDPMWLEMPQWRDVLLYLQEDPKTCRLYESCRQDWFRADGDRRYVTYLFVPPRALTAEEEAELAHYSYIPEYIRGVREGWSILFYDYKNGYVIAPGIQKREDMLKLLPREALEHDDGLEYYFTDDTFAF